MSEIQHGWPHTQAADSDMTNLRRRRNGSSHGGRARAARADGSSVLVATHDEVVIDAADVLIRLR
jgi:hypothetical protein